MTYTMSLDALAEVIRHVRDEYGDDGYAIGIAGGSVVEVAHRDGSRFRLRVNYQAGEVNRLCDNNCGELARPAAVLDRGVYRYLCDTHAQQVTR